MSAAYDDALCEWQRDCDAEAVKLRQSFKVEGRVTHASSTVAERMIAKLEYDVALIDSLLRFCRRRAGESVAKRGLPDRRYCMQEHPEYGQCLMIRGHDGPHRALDSKNSEWVT